MSSIEKLVGRTDKGLVGLPEVKVAPSMAAAAATGPMRRYASELIPDEEDEALQELDTEKRDPSFPLG
jgi:hypothetical protein